MRSSSMHTVLCACLSVPRDCVCVRMFSIPQVNIYNQSNMSIPKCYTTIIRMGAVMIVTGPGTVCHCFRRKHACTSSCPPRPTMPLAPALGEKKKENANPSQKIALERHFLAGPERRSYEEYDAIARKGSGLDGGKAFDYKQVEQWFHNRRYRGGALNVGGQGDGTICHFCRRQFVSPHALQVHYSRNKVCRWAHARKNASSSRPGAGTSSCPPTRKVSGPFVCRLCNIVFKNAQALGGKHRSLALDLTCFVPQVPSNLHSDCSNMLRPPYPLP
jgi:hypothetical protein